MTVGELAAVIAGHGLPRASSPLPFGPLEPSSWDVLARQVVEQRIECLLRRAIVEGAFPATPVQAEAARSLARRRTLRVLQLEGLLVRTSRLFDDQAIQHRIMKGPAMARTVYTHFSDRAFGDIDLIVRPDQFATAVAALEAEGGIRRYDQPRPGFDRRFTKAASVVMPDGLSVDLHRTLVLGPFGLSIRLEDLFLSPGSMTLSGHSIATFNAVTACVHAGLHAALGDWPARLVPLRDVAQFAYLPGLDTGDVVATARSWKADTPLAAALTETERRFGRLDTDLTQWARSHSPTRRDARYLALYQQPDRSYRKLALAATAEVIGVGDKLRYLTSLAFPERAYLARREGSYARRVVEALHLLWRPVGEGERKPGTHSP